MVCELSTSFIPVCSFLNSHNDKKKILIAWFNDYYYHYFADHSDKYWINQELDLRLMLEDVKKYLGDFPNIHPLPDGTIPDTEVFVFHFLVQF